MYDILYRRSARGSCEVDVSTVSRRGHDQVIAHFRSAIPSCAAWLTLALTAASPATAQRVPRLLGSSVRIEVDSSPRLSGVVVRQSTDSLTLRAEGGALGYSVALAHVRHVERYAPRRSALLALGGFLAGGALGYVVGGYAMNRGIAHCLSVPGHGDMCAFDPFTVPVYTLGGAVAGTVVGALVKLPHWEPLF